MLDESSGVAKEILQIIIFFFFASPQLYNKFNFNVYITLMLVAMFFSFIDGDFYKDLC